MTKQTNIHQFFQRFPSDASCLEHLFNTRFGQGHTCPECERETKWYPFKSEHKKINHNQGEYARGNATTDNIENFFNHLKKSIAGTHTSVSRKYLERYVKESEYRFNRRMCPKTMLDELLSRFPELSA